MKPVFAISKLLVKEIFRKKDFYVALILIGVILCYASQLTFYEVENVVRYLIEIGLALVFFFSTILTVVLAARQYPSESQNRTLGVLLSKPLSRFQFMLGKFLGSFFAGGAAFLIFYGLFLLVASGKSGGGLPLSLAAQTGYLYLLNLLVIGAMTVALSHFMTMSANVSTTLITYLLINTYGANLKTATAKLFPLSAWIGKAVYYALPHFEFFDMRQRFIHRWDALSPALLAVLTAYAAAYAALFLLAGWLRFHREPL